MAIYKIFPEKDATLYSSNPLQNTGLDEIIEVSTYFVPSTAQVSRFLIKFSNEEIDDIINNKIEGSVTDETGSLLTSSREFEADLKCYIAEVNGLSEDTMLEIYPLAEEWVMGIGRFDNDPITTEGCSWKYKETSTPSPWLSSPFPPNIGGSSPLDNPGGGAWYIGNIDGLPVKSSYSLDYYSDKDIKVDVTNAIKLFNSGTVENNGFIIKQSDSSEFESSLSKVSNIKYFSIDTHTIYPPQLEFKWRDYTFNTGSSSSTVINTPQLVATLANNKGEFKRGSIHNFYINCRPQFPDRTFKTSSAYTQNYYLPTSSYYAIKDLHTNEFIIDFNNDFTQISADENGSYFKLYMNGLEPERYYQVLIKVEIEGNTIILDDNYHFKVING